MTNHHHHHHPLRQAQSPAQAVHAVIAAALLLAAGVQAQPLPEARPLQLTQSTQLQLGSTAPAREAPIVPAPTVPTTAVLSQTLAPYLPAQALIKQALLASPTLAQARAQKQASLARAKVIEVGPAEFNLRSSLQQRREVNASAPLNESALGIERPFRLWGKRELDAQIANQTQQLAQVEYADVMHEAAREFLTLWFTHLRNLVDQKNAATALTLATRMQRLTQAQLKQGEVSQLDSELASAEWERISAARSLADAQVGGAVAALKTRYPSVGVPMTLPPVLGIQSQTPLPAWGESMQAMRDAFLARNHELNKLRTSAQRFETTASRAQRERLPDPVLGIFHNRERGGMENITGVSLSIALPGELRSYQAQAALADAQAASDKVQAVQQRLSAEFERAWQNLEHKRAAYEHLRSAAQRQTQAADKALKAYTLGEGNLASVLLFSRLASDNLNAAERMQLDVVELVAMMQLDLHQLWDFDE